MRSRFIAQLEVFGIQRTGKPLLVAVSGGVDSMVLMSLLHEYRFPFAVAHCNYQLRGAASDADEALVRKWCSQHQIRLHVKKVETRKLMEETSASLQMVARNERYAFFQELMETHGYGATVLAHHADDRVESLLMNVLRGTGFRGLQGMPSRRDAFIRPLIGFRKEEIRAFADANVVPFREDESNFRSDYLRNRIRLKLMPMLLANDPEIVEMLIAFCERVESELTNYEIWVGNNLAELGDENGISTEGLMDSKAPFTLMKELLRSRGFTSAQIFEVLSILNSDPGAEVRSETHRVVKDRERLLVRLLEAPEEPPKLNFELITKQSLKTLRTEASVALLDADLVEQHALSVRRWQQGDRFKPLGMGRWKLLSDFFVDQKLSVVEKQNVWLLMFQDQIVWVIGNRPDDRFKVTDRTRNVLKVSIR